MLHAIHLWNKLYPCTVYPIGGTVERFLYLDCDINRTCCHIGIQLLVYYGHTQLYTYMVGPHSVTSCPSVLLSFYASVCPSSHLILLDFNCSNNSCFLKETRLYRSFPP